MVTLVSVSRTFLSERRFILKAFSCRTFGTVFLFHFVTHSRCSFRISFHLKEGRYVCGTNKIEYVITKSLPTSKELDATTPDIF